MEEIDIKIEELKSHIGILELDVQKLLNYGNVPDGNFEKAYELLFFRERMKKALDEIQELKQVIEMNKKAD